MKKLLFTLTLLLLPTSAKGIDTLGIVNGDRFEFVLNEFSYQFGGETHFDLNINDDVISGESITLKAGQTFTIEILNTTLNDPELDDDIIIVRYSTSNESIELYQYIGFGELISYTNWEGINSQIGTEVSEGNNVTIIDTDSEFGFHWAYSSYYSDATSSENETGILDVRYDRETGVMNYYFYHHEEFQGEEGVTYRYINHMLITRVGYISTEDLSRDAAPIFEFVTLTSTIIIIQIRRIPYIRRQSI